MSTTNNNAASVSAGPRYSRSFASYEVPFRPDEPIDFADTEGLKSFYASYHDQAGRVVRFDKVQLVRADNAAQEFELPIAAPPGAAVYFEVVRGPATPGLRLGARLDYPQTEHLTELYAGKVGPSGKTGQATLFRKEIAFSDTYDYWPTGHLRKRTMTGPDQPPSVTHYDREGRPVASPVPEPAMTGR